MKKIALVFTFLLLLSVYCFADYKSDVISGVKEYKAKNFSEAYKYFKSAYAQKPSPKLKQYMMAAYKKSKENENSLLEEAGTDASYGDWAPQENIIAVNPLYLSTGIIGLHYERKLMNSLGLGLDAGYSFTGGGFGFSSSTTGGSVSGSGFMGGLQLNWYPQQKALNAWYIGAEFTYYSLGYTMIWGVSNDITDKVTITMMTGGPRGGYRWIFSGGFTVDVTLSLLPMSINTTTDSSEDYFDSSMSLFAFMPTLGTNIGFAF